MALPDDAARPGPVHRGAAYAALLLVALVLALWEAFLVPLRVLGVPLPVSVVLALVGNLVLGRAGGRLLGRWGAAGTGAVWFAVAVAAQTRRPEGDLVVPGTLTGYGFLLLGSLGAAVALGLTPPAGVRAGTRTRT